MSETMKVYMWVGATEKTGYEPQRSVRVIAVAEDYAAARRQVDKALEDERVKHGELLRQVLANSMPVVYTTPFAMIELSGANRTVGVYAAGKGEG